MNQLFKLVEKKPFLFWDCKDLKGLSAEAIVEAILTRGDFDDFMELINILGIKRVAEIFYKQTSVKRKNYGKKTENYFRLFFERHLGNV